MRVDLKKFIFIGPLKVKETFFKEAQKVGVIDFAEKRKSGFSHSEELEAIVSAIKVLRKQPPVEQLEDVNPSKAKRFVHKLNALWEKLEADRQRLIDLQNNWHEVHSFGYFPPEKIEAIERDGKMHVQFFSGRIGISKEQLPQEGFIQISTGEELAHYISIAKERRVLPKMVEVQIDKPLSELEAEIEEVKDHIHEREEELKAYLPYNDAFHELLLEQSNLDSLAEANLRVESGLDGQLFMATGWVPVDDIDEIKPLCKKSKVFFDEVLIGKGERIPTCLKNSGFHRVGEDLVHIYDTPSPEDKDPSLWVVGFFALFFAIIINDAGYGTIFLLMSLYFWFKFPNLKGLKRRFLTLVTTLSIGCIVWGVLSNSYFGIDLSLDNPLRKVSVVNWLVEQKAAYHLNLKDDVYSDWVEKYPQVEQATSGKEFLAEAVEVKNGKESYIVVNKFSGYILLELALLIGVLHVCVGMARYLRSNWAMGGWILFIIGAYLYVPVHLNYTSIVQFGFGMSRDFAQLLGIELMIVGLSIALILSVVQHRLLGLLEIATVIQILGDILSYLRLYALGLAGGIMAATINEMADALPLVVSVILIAFAHIFNMGLAIMGGVIHGLRLNFLEWYHYCFEGGGKQFQPLRIKTKDE